MLKQTLMKKIIILFIVAAISISCKNEPKKVEKKEDFPNELAKVFEKHGGIQSWREQQTLSFTKEVEVHTIDLHSRKSVINAPTYSLGFDGKEVWLSQKDSTSFKGNKDFYHNLYFYFYAMPFVLADDGIVYEASKPLVFEGKSYPGIKISFKANTGSSPDDNYYLYYNPDTFQMEWLEYSVTFYSKKASEKVSTIRYNDWVDVDGFLLPKSLTWYKKDEKGVTTEPSRPATEFTDVVLSKEKQDENSFYKPNE